PRVFAGYPTEVDVLPESFEPEGVDYWKKVQKDFRDKFGDDEYEATAQIAKEIGVGNKVLGLIESIGFKNSENVYFSGNLEKMICTYCDQRVSPDSIVSLDKRFEEGSKRFQSHHRVDEIFSNKMNRYLKDIEKEIYKNSTIDPGSINEPMVIPLLPILESVRFG
ncbi:MAG: hypothetical protein ACMG6E_00295, partial [Candidatus Roizmanbacteria bacterium]